jgi:transposase InsO family protein
MDGHTGKALVMEALEMVAAGRSIEGVIHHSDRGCQYTSSEHRPPHVTTGHDGHMSRKGNCWDNASAESFSATLQTEPSHRRPWSTRQSATDVANEYIALFYNSSRLHWFAGGLSAIDYERAFDDSAGQAAKTICQPKRGKFKFCSMVDNCDFDTFRQYKCYSFGVNWAI